MNKSRRFKRSQAAHKRLEEVARRKMKHNDYEWVRSNYHSSVYSEQEKKGRILSKDERAKIYSRVEFFFSH